MWSSRGILSFESNKLKINTHTRQFFIWLFCTSSGFTQVNCFDSRRWSWMETATLCDPDTSWLASWRQRPSLSPTWTQAYKSTSAHFGLWTHHTNRGQCCNRTFASGNMGFASRSALWSISASWQCNLKI